MTGPDAGGGGSAPWLPTTFEHPTRFDLSTGHHLRPIRADDVDLDYPAVMGSRGRLWAMYGEVWGWPPAEMTVEEDRADLVRHEDEMERSASFNYAIFDDGEGELLGCVYIDPAEHEGDAEAIVNWWVVDHMVDSPLEAELAASVPRWLAAEWPFANVRYGV